VLGCAIVAFSLPATSVLAGAAVLLAGAAVWGAKERWRRGEAGA
jgi:APA family basic amino acid/polyamine antiporter